MNRHGIFWLASYPKSGNTWVRCLIASLQNDAAAMDLNGLGRQLPNAASRIWLERFVDMDTGDLMHAELDLLRSAAYRQCAAHAMSLLKIHDSYDADLFPAEATLGTVYIVRDPRDVAPSWADHMRVDLDTAIRQMADPHLTMSEGLHAYRPQARQRFGSWSGHVASWLHHAPAPCLLLRYEDLQAQPSRETARLAAFLGLPADADRVARAVAACRFDALREIEEHSGFIERRDGQPRFFRQGRAGAWQSALHARQAARLVTDHGAMMRQLGYDTGTASG
ncbi:sulfotransferase domain-containing protein [Xanthomonas theicola]|uniref:Aryl sulfotransferase n=1 Tax=Xanthomonas theicola TaxID=56464 RepID=A0A2S6ZKC8_9XANT|nr:sulfotransferase domain-containing protein [Xanthomonas theicola]PPT92639.1 aryl sulfotransferase [Xanthomonas theicola]QNH26168.1 sulfotransferase domain-containing protein [Xanthomonas theicola]